MGNLIALMVVVAIVVLAICALAASKFEEIAKMKGHRGYFWWCFLLGAAGWAMVIALPDRGASSVHDSEAVNRGAPEADDTLPEL